MARRFFSLPDDQKMMYYIGKSKVSLIYFLGSQSPKPGRG